MPSIPYMTELAWNQSQHLKSRLFRDRPVEAARHCRKWIRHAKHFPAKRAKILRGAEAEFEANGMERMFAAGSSEHRYFALK